MLVLAAMQAAASTGREDVGALRTLKATGLVRGTGRRAPRRERAGLHRARQSLAQADSLAQRWAPHAQPAALETTCADGDERQYTREQRLSYVARLRSLDGITRDVSHFVVDVLSRAQDVEETPIRGSYGEWGTYKGKFLIALLQNARAHELSGGIFVADAFENLHREGGNAAGGLGCRACFESQMRGYAPGSVEHTGIYDKDTKKLQVTQVKRLAKQPFRMVSIDGDHSFEATRRDLCIAAGHMVPGAILVLDDICNRDWPEVLPAWRAFVVPGGCQGYVGSTVATDTSGTLEPFASIGCKLWVTTAGTGHAARYEQAILDSDPEFVRRYGLQRRDRVTHARKELHGPARAMFPPSSRQKRLLTQKTSNEMGIPPGHHPSMHGGIEADLIDDATIRQIHAQWLHRNVPAGRCD